MVSFARGWAHAGATSDRPLVVEPTSVLSEVGPVSRRFSCLSWDLRSGRAIGGQQFRQARGELLARESLIEPGVARRAQRLEIDVRGEPNQARVGRGGAQRATRIQSWQGTHPTSRRRPSRTSPPRIVRAPNPASKHRRRSAPVARATASILARKNKSRTNPSAFKADSPADGRIVPENSTRSRLAACARRRGPVATRPQLR